MINDFRATSFATFTTSLNLVPMNGPEGLRAQGSRHGVKGVKKLSKHDLIVAIADILADAAVAEHEAQLARDASAAQDAKAATSVHRSRNANATIRPTGDATTFIDAVWAALTSESGVSTADITRVVVAGTTGLQPGAVVSRLGTQRVNGFVTSKNVPDAKNRPVAYWSATSEWSKEAMAKSFLKIKG